MVSFHMETTLALLMSAPSTVCASLTLSMLTSLAQEHLFRGPWWRRSCKGGEKREGGTEGGQRFRDAMPLA